MYNNIVEKFTFPSVSSIDALEGQWINYKDHGYPKESINLRKVMGKVKKGMPDLKQIY